MDNIRKSDHCIVWYDSFFRLFRCSSFLIYYAENIDHEVSQIVVYNRIPYWPIEYIVQCHPVDALNNLWYKVMICVCKVIVKMLSCMHISVRVGPEEKSVDACRLADLISILLKKNQTGVCRLWGVCRPSLISLLSFSVSLPMSVSILLLMGSPNS